MRRIFVRIGISVAFYHRLIGVSTLQANIDEFGGYGKSTVLLNSVGGMAYLIDTPIL